MSLMYSMYSTEHTITVMLNSNPPKSWTLTHIRRPLISPSDISSSVAISRMDRGSVLTYRAPFPPSGADPPARPARIDRSSHLSRSSKSLDVLRSKRAGREQVAFLCTESSSQSTRVLLRKKSCPDSHARKSWNKGSRPVMRDSSSSECIACQEPIRTVLARYPCGDHSHRCVRM
jgi:hypothetical protein